ncbi:MAG: ABC transporter permease subunit [Candidatus Bathyarchaeia archaeon]
MDFNNVWSVALKDIETYKQKKSIIYSTLILPIIVSALFSFTVKNQIVPSPEYQLGLQSLTYFFVVLAAILPSAIAAYSMVGEKIEKSLEPLLATPMSDGEILLGKSIAAFLLPILAVWAGATIFMMATDYLMFNSLGYYYFPNWNAGVMLLLLAPLAAMFSIEFVVIISSRVSDVRSANQLGMLLLIPFALVFIAGVTGVITFEISNLLIFSLFLIIVDIALFLLSKSTFKREEILTKWK